MQQPQDRPMMSQADACTYHMHCPMTSQANTSWALLLQFHLVYTFTPATLGINETLLISPQKLLQKVHPRFAGISCVTTCASASAPPIGRPPPSPTAAARGAGPTTQPPSDCVTAAQTESASASRTYPSERASSRALSW